MYRFKLKQLIHKYGYETGKDLTITELSEKLGINRTTLTHMANNKPGVNPGMAIIDKICSFFDCQPNDLIEIREKFD